MDRFAVPTLYRTASVQLPAPAHNWCELPTLAPETKRLMPVVFPLRVISRGVLGPGIAAGVRLGDALNTIPCGVFCRVNIMGTACVVVVRPGICPPATQAHS